MHCQSITNLQGIFQTCYESHLTHTCREDERKRIQAAGGWIVDSKDLNISQLYRINPELIKEMQIPSRLVESVGFISTSRVCGELSGRTRFIFCLFSFSFL